MDYQGMIDILNKIGCILSVEIKSDGSCGDICVEAANDTYLQSVNVTREEFVPGRPYYNYVPPTRNYEEMCFRCVSENRMIHSYINVGLYNAWMEVYLLPLKSEKEGKGYLLFSYDMTPIVDAEKMSDLSPDIAIQVFQLTVKLRESDDFREGMNSVIKDIRTSCESKRCCILMTDFDNEYCSVIAEDVDESEGDIPDVNSFVENGFYNIVKTWDKLIAGSNCYIIHDEKEMELLKEKNEIWYDSLKMAGVYSLVIYPLKSNGETIGYIWVTNFNSDNTLRIKSILEVTAFILASEIASYQLFRKMKIMSDTDLLTGLLNRNAMNNRITDIVSGINPLTTYYGVVFADLNGLKAVNDKSGHIAGDNLLKGAAIMLQESFPDCDIFRVGGDEFLILVIDKTEDEFDSLVENLKKNSEASDTVKLAVGTCYGDETMDIRFAMHVADERMYHDKDIFYENHPDMPYRSNR